MLRFESDYLEGAHPSIIKKLTETNFEQTPGYGLDPHCEAAAALIKKECGAVNVNVHFLVGGTQANTTVIASILKAHQGVLSSDAGHIAAHESGAIEATGHKVLTLPHKNGKITGRQISDYCTAHYADPSFEHTVQPGMVYISNSTEYGTVYTKAELTDISAACREHGLYLFMDGARLGYALSSPGSDLTFAGHCRALRRLLYRRNKGRRALRRGHCDFKSCNPQGFPLSHKAARRNAGKGQAVGDTV